MDKKVLDEYDIEIEERFGLSPLKSTEEKIIDRLKNYLNAEITNNQFNINNYNTEDIRDVKQIGDTIYVTEPISSTCEELLSLIDKWEKEYERRSKRKRRSK